MTEAIPKLYDHTKRMYDTLAEIALDKDGTLVFEGSKVEAFRKLGISQAYYTPIFDSLTELGCIEQVQRGTSSSPTIIRLMREPEPEEFVELYRKDLTRPTQFDTLRQMIEDVNRRLPQIDVDRFIRSVDTRLQELESRVAVLEQQGR